MTGLFADTDFTKPAKPRPDEIDASDPVVMAIAEKAGRQFDAECDRMVCEVLERKYVAFLESNDIAASTAERYTKAFVAFQDWCRGEGLPSCALPASVAVVASYLHTQREAGASAWRVRFLAAAIGWAHKLEGQLDPTKHELVQAIIAATRAADTERRRKPNGKAHH
jgi:hypothetical protein